jgi:hypothetical protein
MCAWRHLGRADAGHRALLARFDQARTVSRVRGVSQEYAMSIARYDRIRLCSGIFLLPFTLTLLTVFPDTASGETIHHWRFENGSFLEDSEGTADLTNTTVTQVDLSTLNPASAFPVPGGLADNSSAAEFHDTGGLLGTMVPLVGSWTIEMLVRTDNLNGTWGQALFNNAVDRCNSSSNVGMQFRMDGSGGAAPGELSVWSGSLTAHVWLPLGFIPEIGKDYYFGFVHDDDADTLTFYLKDLTAMDPSIRSTFKFEAYRFPDATGVEIGNVSGGACGADSHAHDGVIDEVRVTDVALPEMDLYVTDIVFKDGFEASGAE